jgi:MYXO-CTERM domain-containing protein
MRLSIANSSSSVGSSVGSSSTGASSKRGSIAASIALAVFGSLGCSGESVSSRPSALRPDMPDEGTVFRFAPEDVIERYDEERVRVHYTRDGSNAVPAADEDGSGVPDFVELAGDATETALDFYAAEGFLAPLGDAALAENGGDARFDVYLVDFFGSADGAFVRDRCSTVAGSATCIGHFVMENDFGSAGPMRRERAARIVATHELFHAVQVAYDAARDSILSEATAVWATDRLDPELREVATFSGGYLESIDRPLDVPRAGVVLDPFAYGSAIFFQFLEERHDEVLMLELWEACAAEPDEGWLALLDELLMARGSSFAEEMETFAIWNLHTDRRANPEVSYAEGARYPPVTLREEALPLIDERPRHARAATRGYSFSPGGRTSIDARLGGTEEDRAGLALRLARVDDDVLTVAEAGTTRLDVAGADEVIVLVVNTARAGEARRATVCVGDPSELSACDAPVPMEDAAVDLDAGIVVDAGVEADAGTPSEGGGDGCGCRSGGSSAAGWMGVAIVALLRRRRR